MSSCSFFLSQTTWRTNHTTWRTNRHTKHLYC